MTDCTQAHLSFSSLGCKKIEADYEGGCLTSDTGALVLRESDLQLGLTEALTACIVDPRDQDHIVHPQVEMLRQRIYAIALGYEDLNVHETLRRNRLYRWRRSVWCKGPAKLIGSSARSGMPHRRGTEDGVSS